MNRPHGVAATYLHGKCRCAPCRYAHSAAARQRRPHADPGPVQQHLRQLALAGVSNRRAAALASVGQVTVYRIVNGITRPSARVADALLAVEPDAGPPPLYAPGAGVVRRLRALRTLGWSVQQLVAESGISINWITHLSMGRCTGVYPSTAAKAGAVYRRLSMIPARPGPTAARNINLARKRLWFPPLAWDDDTIDDPAALPCLLPPVARVAPDLELLVQHVVAGHPVEPTPEARAEIVRRMRGRRLADVAAAARCSTKRVSDLRLQMAGRSA